MFLHRHTLAPGHKAGPALLPKQGSSRKQQQLTCGLAQGAEVHRHIMLPAAQGAAPAFQVVPIASVLSHPLDLIPAVRFSGESGNGTLAGRVSKKRQIETLKCHVCVDPPRFQGAQRQDGGLFVCLFDIYVFLLLPLEL